MTALPEESPSESLLGGRICFPLIPSGSLKRTEFVLPLSGGMRLPSVFFRESTEGPRRLLDRGLCS